MRFVSVGKTMTTLYLSFVASYLGLGFDFQKRGFSKKKSLCIYYNKNKQQQQQKNIQQQKFIKSHSL